MEVKCGEHVLLLWQQQGELTSCHTDVWVCFELYDLIYNFQLKVIYWYCWYLVVRTNIIVIICFTQVCCVYCSLTHNNVTDTGAIALAKALQQNKSLEELKWVVNWVSCYSIHYLHQFWSTLFHSLEGNAIGDSGATALSDALRVNQSLKTLE